MAKPKKDLSAALAKAKDAQNFETPVEAKPVAVVKSEQSDSGAGEKRSVSSTREGRKAIAIYLDTNVHKQLKYLSIEKETTIQELSETAILNFLEANK